MDKEQLKKEITEIIKDSYELDLTNSIDVLFAINEIEKNNLAQTIYGEKLKKRLERVFFESDDIKCIICERRKAKIACSSCLETINKSVKYKPTQKLEETADSISEIGTDDTEAYTSADLSENSNKLSCPVCGKINHNDALFCSYCGYAIYDNLENEDNGYDDYDDESIESSEGYSTAIVKKADSESHYEKDLDYLSYRKDDDFAQMIRSSSSSSNSNNANLKRNKTISYILIGFTCAVILFSLVKAIHSSGETSENRITSSSPTATTTSTVMSTPTEHYCQAYGCSNKTEGASHRYCRDHECSYNGCTSKSENGTDRCPEHGYMIGSSESPISIKSGSFSLNSAGGIDLDITFQNGSSTISKEVKYIRFDVTLYNAVGDAVKDEIKGTTYRSVEVIGPVAVRDTVRFHEVIGYCDVCDHLIMGNVTVIFMDGTTQTLTCQKRINKG